MKKWLLRGMACLALVASVAWFAACSNNSGGGNDGDFTKPPANNNNESNTGGNNNNNENNNNENNNGNNNNNNGDEDSNGGGSINDGPGTTYEGFFKSEIKGSDFQIWEDEWAEERPLTFAMDGSTVVVRNSAWWGGAYVGYEGMEFDVSKVASVKFDVESDTDGDIWVSPFGADSNKKVFSLLANEKKTDLLVDVKESFKKSTTLFSFGGNDFPVDSKITFTNFAFCDKDGKEIVPPVIEKNEEDEKPMDGTWRGFFKQAIDGIQPQVWGNTFELDMPSLVKKGGVNDWWGGAFVGYDNTPYDMSEVYYARFDIESDTDGGVYVNAFGADSNKKTLTLKAGEPQTNVKIEVQERFKKSISLVSFGGWDDGGKMGNGATITIKNFVFLDKNEKEIVPKATQKFVASNEPNFGGFFKSEIESLDVQIWENTFMFASPTIVKTGSWWGGAFLGGGKVKYDVSQIKSAKFKCTINENALDAADKKGGLSVTLFGKDKNKKEFKDLELDKELDLSVDVVQSLTESDILFQIAGIDPQQTILSTFTIKNFAFYDEDDNEVVPKIVKE